MKRYLYLLVVLIGGALLMQGSQCSSREMTSAKTAIANQDYQKAMDYINKELAVNPNNGEAHMLMAELQRAQKKYDEALVSVNKAEPLLANDAKLKNKPNEFKNSLWPELYDEAYKLYNDYNKSKNEAAIKKSIELLGLGSKLKPELMEFYVLRGQFMEIMSDTNGALSVYQQYVDLLAPELKLAKDYKIHINMKRDKLIDKLGKPVKTIASGNLEGDSILTDIFVLNQKEAFFYYIKKDDAWKVDGWRYDLPKNWNDNEKIRLQTMNTTPFAGLAQTYYNRGQKEKALASMIELAALEPDNQSYNTYLVQLFNETGNKAGAAKFLETLIDQDPTSKEYITQYADFYLTSDELDKAIVNYEKALKIDPDYSFANRNIGIAYKNKASKIQKIQTDKMDADKNYKGNPDEYFPLLRKSTEYFEKAAQSPQLEKDITLNIEIALNYFVLNDKAKLDKKLKELDKLESELFDDQKDIYYGQLLKIYGALVGTDPKYQAKFDELSKKAENK